MKIEMIKKIAVQMLAAWVLVIGLTATAQAATLTVTKTADTNDGVCNADCSLREAIAAAASGDTIVFASPLFDTPQVINVNGALVINNQNLTITGKGANLLTVRNTAAASFTSRVFLIGSGSDVNLSGMTITGGNVLRVGGGIFHDGNGTLMLTGVHITGNSAQEGGGIFSTGVLTIANSTISNNAAFGQNRGTGGGIDNRGLLTVTNTTISGNRVTGFDFNGGGIYSDTIENVTITNSTITDNEAVGANSAGGVLIELRGASLRNSIVAGNRNNTTTPDVHNPNNVAFVSNGYNIIGNRGSVTDFNQTGDQTGTAAAPINPLLAPLANNGGTTPTHALLTGSPAIDKGKSFGSITDQRGLTRPFDDPSIPNATDGDGSDIGAYEFGGLPLRVLSISRDSADIVITFEGAIAGRTYGLERKLLLTEMMWESPLNGATDFTATENGEGQITHTGGAAEPKAFYRVRLLP